MRLNVKLKDFHGEVQEFQCDHVTTDAQPTGFYVEKSFNNFVAFKFSNNWCDLEIKDNEHYVDEWKEERAKLKAEKEAKKESDNE